MLGLKYLQHMLAVERKNSKKFDKDPGIRQSESMRGVSMRSKWCNDFVTHPSVDAIASALAGTPVEPHTMMMNRGHVNYGKISDGRVVDQVC